MIKIISSTLLKTSKGYDYSSTQIELPKKISDRIIKWGKKEIIDNNLFIDSDGTKGREDDIHVTVKYGLHTTNVEEVKNIQNDNKGLIKSQSSFGYHEVIAETPNHKKQLYDLPVEHIYELLKVYSIRIKSLSRKKNIKYVLVFKNHGKDAGTSLKHSHTQIVGVPKLPTSIKEKIKY